jgi:CheY-like chemotaxis protein
MPTKILAIDDSKTMRLAIKITFAAEDADVTSVSKGSEAVARAKQMAADVVLIDARLANGEPSGYDVCHQLKSDPSTSGIPVVLLVSGQSGVDTGKFKSSGADGWIAKPFDTQELIDKVAEVVGGAVAQPAAASGVRPASGAAGRPAAATRTAAPQTPAPRPTTRPPVAAAPPAAAARPYAAAEAAPARPVAAASPSTSRTMPVGSANRPVAAQQPVAAARPAVKVAPAPARPLAPGEIPIAIPIPFTAADSPTPGILARLQEAGHGAGLDPRVAEALVAMSREVIEAVVWEVVPDLAEQIIKQQSVVR